MKRSSFSGYLLLDHQLRSPSPIQREKVLLDMVGKDVVIVLGAMKFTGKIKLDTPRYGNEYAWFKFVSGNGERAFNLKTTESGLFEAAMVYKIEGNVIELFERED